MHLTAKVESLSIPCSPAVMAVKSLILRHTTPVVSIDLFSISYFSKIVNVIHTLQCQ